MRARGYNTDMGLMPSGGGARSAARAGLSAALGLSLLGSAAPARGQTDQDGFYVGLEVGRANASTLTSVVTGVNHPTRCDRLLYPASTSPPASDEACRASTPTAILRNAFNPGGGVVSGLLFGYRADRVRVEVEYLTRSQGPATAAVGATTDVALQGKDTEWSDDQPPREWIRDYTAHQIFANAYYDFPNESPWTPYVGGGLGVAITTLNYANQFIRKPDVEYLRIDFEPDWPDAAKRAAAGTLSALDTTVRQEAFGFQVLAGADYALTEHTSVGVTGRWAQFGHITDEATWDLIRSHAPVQADGVTPFDTHAAIRGHQLPGGDGRPEVPLLTDPGPSDRAAAVCSLTWACGGRLRAFPGRVWRAGRAPFSPTRWVRGPSKIGSGPRIQGKGEGERTTPPLTVS